MKKVEYRVRPITRYVVTRHEAETFDDGRCSGGCRERGTFDNGETAYHVAYALCRKEHEDSGEPLESMNFVYPNIPDGVSVSPN